MKKVLALVAISGMAAFYACGNGEKQEETTTTTTESTQTTEQTSVPADTSALQTQDTAHHTESQH